MERRVERLLNGEKFKNMIHRRLEDFCKSYGIKQVDTEILLYIYNCPESDTASDIQKYLMINKGYLSQRLDALCKMGYIRAVPDQTDRRYVHYLLEDKAKCLADEICRIREETDRKLFMGISQSELEFLHQISVKIDKNIQNILNGE